MLFTESFNLTTNELHTLNEIKDEIRLLGFNFDIEGNELILSAKPIDVKNGAEEQDFKEILELYSEFQEQGRMTKRENIAASIGLALNINS